MPKSSGSAVISGALNGEAALTVRADKLAIDSRYAQIMHVMRAAEERRPRLRRLGDQLGAFYTPLAVGLAMLAWGLSGDVHRCLAVLVVATPCPLLIAIPVAVIGSIALAARRGIIIRDPSVLERIETCRMAIFDKTGTLTYGQPVLTEIVVGEQHDGVGSLFQVGPKSAESKSDRDGRPEKDSRPLTADKALSLIGSVERYSKHPLAAAILDAVREQRIALQDATEVHELPGQGLTGVVAGRQIRITSRSKLVVPPLRGALQDSRLKAELRTDLPPQVAGMECIAIIDDQIPVTLRFRDQPRADGASFVKHLAPNHHFQRVMIVSGDRESEVRYLADLVGIHEVHFSDSACKYCLRRRRHQRRAGTDDRDRRHRVRRQQRHHLRGRARRDPRQFAGQGGRVAAHRPATATDRTAKRRRRNVAEHRGDDPRRVRSLAVSRRRDRSRSHRPAGRAECPACGSVKRQSDGLPRVAST